MVKKCKWIVCRLKLQQVAAFMIYCKEMSYMPSKCWGLNVGKYSSCSVTMALLDLIMCSGVKVEV